MRQFGLRPVRAGGGHVSGLSRHCQITFLFGNLLPSVHVLCQKYLVMEVTTKIDRFGRVLIPKTLREVLGLQPTSEVILKLVSSKTLTITPKISLDRPRLEVDQFGLPTFHFGTLHQMDYDFTAAILADREQRGLPQSS